MALTLSTVGDSLINVLNGNVGIGTTTIESKCTVNGDMSVSGIVYASTVKNMNEKFTVAKATGDKFLKWLTGVTNEAKANWWASSTLRFTMATFAGTQLDGTTTLDNKYFGGILLQDGRVLFISRSSEMIGIYNPTDNTFVQTANSAFTSDAYLGGVLLPDGRVVFVPQNSTKIGILSGFPPVPKERCLHPCFNKF